MTNTMESSEERRERLVMERLARLRRRRLVAEMNRRFEQFQEYASAGNLLALQNILGDYQSFTRDNS